MKMKTPTQDTIVNKLSAVFGAFIGAWLSRLIVSLAPDDQAKVFNGLIALGATGLYSFLDGKGALYNLTAGSLLGMVADRTATLGQQFIQDSGMVTVPENKEGLTMAAKLQLAAAGYNVTQLESGLAGAEMEAWDASIWDRNRTIPADDQRSQPIAQIAGYTKKSQQRPAGY